MKKLRLKGFDEILQNRVLDKQESPNPPQVAASAAMIAQVELSRKRGLQEFIIEGVKYYAISQQSAVKIRERQLENLINER